MRLTKAEMEKQEKEFDSTLIGLPIEEAYDKIIAKGLRTNWSRTKYEDMIVDNVPRILIFWPDYITIQCDSMNYVKSTRRG